MIVGSGANYHVKLNDLPPVNRHRPSVDMLLDSVAKSAGKNAVAAILTGMGHDGAKGMLALHQTGARTLAQSEKTCVVYGMPREAVALNAVSDVVDLELIAQTLLKNVVGQARRI